MARTFGPEVSLYWRKKRLLAKKRAVCYFVGVIYYSRINNTFKFLGWRKFFEPWKFVLWKENLEEKFVSHGNFSCCKKTFSSRISCGCGSWAELDHGLMSVLRTVCGLWLTTRSKAAETFINATTNSWIAASNPGLSIDQSGVWRSVLAWRTSVNLSGCKYCQIRCSCLTPVKVLLL